MAEPHVAVFVSVFQFKLKTIESEYTDNFMNLYFNLAKYEEHDCLQQVDQTLYPHFSNLTEHIAYQCTFCKH